MDLKDLRTEIDSIDKELISLFEKRMNTAAKIGEYKKQNDIPVYDPQREREKLAEIVSNASEDMMGYSEKLYDKKTPPVFDGIMIYGAVPGYWEDMLDKFV